MALKKRVRIIKKTRERADLWKFISLRKIGSRVSGTNAPVISLSNGGKAGNASGNLAGQTPSEATEAQRRKQNELVEALAIRLVGRDHSICGGQSVSDKTVTRAKERGAGSLLEARKF